MLEFISVSIYRANTLYTDVAIFRGVMPLKRNEDFFIFISLCYNLCPYIKLALRTPREILCGSKHAKSSTGGSAMILPFKYRKCENIPVNTLNDRFLTYNYIYIVVETRFSNI